MYFDLLFWLWKRVFFSYLVSTTNGFPFTTFGPTQTTITQPTNFGLTQTTTTQQVTFGLTPTTTTQPKVTTGLNSFDGLLESVPIQQIPTKSPAITNNEQPYNNKKFLQMVKIYLFILNLIIFF